MCFASTKHDLEEAFRLFLAPDLSRTFIAPRSHGMIAFGDGSAQFLT